MALVDLVPTLLTTTGAIFGRFRYPCCLELLSKAIEMFGREGNIYTDEVLIEAMKSVCQALSPVFEVSFFFRLVTHLTAVTVSPTPLIV